MRHRRFFAGGVCACLLAAVQFGLAAEVSDTALLIEVRNQDSSVTMKVLFSEGTWDANKEVFAWDLQRSKTFKDPLTNAVIGTLKSCKLRIYGQQNLRINIDYAVEAGPSSTAFIVTPGLLSWQYPEGYACEAKARASVYFQDKNGDGINVRAPGRAGQSMFLAQYDGLVPNGEQYTALLGAVSGGPGSSGTVSQTDPAYGYRQVDAKPEDMSSLMRTLISPEDYIEVSTRWNIHLYSGGTPEGTFIPPPKQDDGSPPP